MEFGDWLEFWTPVHGPGSQGQRRRLVALATDPATPKNVHIHVTPPVGFAGIDDTVLTWTPTRSPAYRVRGSDTGTSAADWTQAIVVGSHLVTLDFAKDTCIGVRAVDQAGHRRRPASPITVTT